MHKCRWKVRRSFLLLLRGFYPTTNFAKNTSNQTSQQSEKKFAVLRHEHREDNRAARWRQQDAQVREIPGDPHSTCDRFYVRVLGRAYLYPRGCEIPAGVLQHFFIYKWHGQKRHKITNKPINVLVKWHFFCQIFISQEFCPHISPHISPNPVLSHQLGLRPLFNRVSIKKL